MLPNPEELKQIMNLDVGTTLAFITCFGGLLVTFIRQQVVLKSIENRQDSLESRIVMMEKMMDRRNTIDDETTRALSDVRIAIMELSSNMNNLVKRLEHDLWKK